MAEAQKLEDRGEPEKAVEAYLKILERADALKEPELLTRSYRRLARAGYRLNVYYTERSAELYIEAMEAAHEEDQAREDELREQADEFLKKAKQAFAASQRYDKKTRQAK